MHAAASLNHSHVGLASKFHQPVPRKVTHTNGAFPTYPFDACLTRRLASEIDCRVMWHTATDVSLSCATMHPSGRMAAADLHLVIHVIFVIAVPSPNKAQVDPSPKGPLATLSGE